MSGTRWSPDGKHLFANAHWPPHAAIYDFETRRWAYADAWMFGWHTWSKDSKYVYGIIEPQMRLVRIAVATRKVEEIHSVNELRLNGGAGASWTPDWEPVVLADMNIGEIYRLDVDW